jgi:predicted RNase H-like HicB family nuclease
MLIQYCNEALKQAIYKQLEDASWFAEIPGFQGVWANAESVEATREELFEVLQEWLELDNNTPSFSDSQNTHL